MGWFLTGMVLAAMALVFTAWFRETSVGDAVAEVPALVGELGRAVRRGWRLGSPDRPIEWRELERRGARMLRREVKPSIAGTRIVPSVCTLLLSPRDFDATNACHPFVAQSIRTWLAQQAKRRGWQLPGGVPTIRFVPDSAVLDGELLCRTAWSDSHAPGRSTPPKLTRVDLEPTRLAVTVAADPVGGDQIPPSIRLVGPGVDLLLGTSTPEVVLGRSRRCTARIDDPKVSGEHATLRRTGRGWEIADMSRNGTWIDEQRITEATPLGAATRLRVGDTTLVIARESN